MDHNVIRLFSRSACPSPLLVFIIDENHFHLSDAAGGKCLNNNYMQKQIAKAAPMGDQSAENTAEETGRPATTGALRRAIDELERETAEAPNVVEPWVCLANCYRKIGQTDKATHTLEHALKLQPDDGQLWLLLGSLREISHQWSKAIGALEKAVAIDPKLVCAWSLLACCYMEVDQPQRAAETLKQAVEFNPEEGVLWRELSIACAQTGQKQEARDAHAMAAVLQLRKAA